MPVLLSFASVIVVVHQETSGPQWWRSSLHSDTEMPCSKHEGHGDALYITFMAFYLSTIFCTPFCFEATNTSSEH